MKRLVVLFVVATLTVLTLALPALAAPPEYLYRYLPPGTGAAYGVWGWAPNGGYGWWGVGDLMVFCRDYGGYYYSTPDTPEGYYWQSCDANGTGNTV